MTLNARTITVKFYRHIRRLHPLNVGSGSVVMNFGIQNVVYISPKLYNVKKNVSFRSVYRRLNRIEFVRASLSISPNKLLGERMNSKISNRVLCNSIPPIEDADFRRPMGDTHSQ